MKKIILIILIICLSSCDSTSNNIIKDKLKRELSEIEKQDILEKEMFSDIQEYTIDNPKIILDPYNSNPLSALIIFKSDTIIPITLTIKGKDNIDIINTFPENNIHYIPVLGLYEDYDNQVILSTNDNSYTYTIKTDSLDNNIKDYDELYVDKSYKDDDIYLVSPAGNGNVLGYDYLGNIRYYHNYENAPVWDFRKLNNGLYIRSTDRLNNQPYYNTGFVVTDLLGKIYREYTLPDGYHHDLCQLDNNNFLVLSNEYEDNTIEDIIIEIDYETGNIIRTIDLKDIIPLEQGKSENWSEEDWFHNNSISFDKYNNSIILSGRHQDIVISIDYDTNELEWILGNPDGWSQDMKQYFLKPLNELEYTYSQHAAKVIDNNRIMIFDNGNNRSKNKDTYLDPKDNYSRGVIYEIDHDNMTVTQLYEYGKERGSEFYSNYVSDIDYIQEDNYLITSGGIVYDNNIIQNQPFAFYENATAKSIIVEVNNNKVLYELKLPYNTYRTEKIDLYDNLYYGLEKGLNLGNQEDTFYKEIIEEEIKPTKTLEDLKENEIEVVLEHDRLSVKGVYHKSDLVDIIIVKDNKQYVYEVPTKLTSYTAMCAYIPNDDHISDEYSTVIKYITNLGGNNHIYIRKNREIYDLNMMIE